jgi:hypothetical protein
VTRTPNRSITSIPNWWVKGFVLFFVLIFLGSCLDENSLIGVKKPVSPFGVYYKEFDIPATTVQTDSVRASVSSLSDRLLCGVATDLNFGKVTASLFAQFASTSRNSPKIDKTGKTNFTVEGVSIRFVLSPDYYVYGDTANSQLDFTLHQITDTDFKETNDYFTSSSVVYDLAPLGSSGFYYNHDSIVSHRKKNFDASTSNNRYDTLQFTLPLTFGQKLLDTALANGVKYFNEKDEWVLNPIKTDSVFRIAFPGFALVPAAGNTKVLGFSTAFTALKSSTAIIVSYSYVKDGSTVNGKLYYTPSYGPGFSKIDYDRSGKVIAGLTEKHTDFNAPDDYCYLQSGTGLYAKLDFSAVHQYFDASPTDTIMNAAINSAELIVEIEPDINRHHLSKSNKLIFRVVNNSNRFFRAPAVQVTTSSGPFVDVVSAYKYNYNAVGGDRYNAVSTSQAYLDIADDGGGRFLTKSSKVGQELLYQGYVSNFLEQFLRIPSGYEKVYYMALLPGDNLYGKSFHGLSFKKNKVKLRVYYTKVL